MRTQQTTARGVTGTGNLFRWIALVACSLAANFIWAQGGLEYNVKAAFLLNFTKFVEWPAGAFADADSPLAICILGKDPFGHNLDEIIQGEIVNNRRLVVRRLEQQAPAPQMCQVVFIDSSDRDASKILRGLGRGVLTVGDGENFIREGGMIGFLIDDRRVRFVINQAAADKAALKLSSRLLSVAKSVEK